MWNCGPFWVVCVIVVHQTSGFLLINIGGDGDGNNGTDTSCHHGHWYQDRNGHYHCNCDPGWTGTHCTTQEVQDACDGVDCHHGDCHHDRHSSQTHCTCNAGWTGTHCTEQDPCHNIHCNNHGTCVVRRHQSYPHHLYAHCTCDAGYSGTYCTDYDLCHNFDCNNNHGTCHISRHRDWPHHDYAHCTCADGYSGTHCTTSSTSAHQCTSGHFRPVLHTGCRHYQECVKGQWQAFFVCPDSLAFNSDIQTCDWNYRIDLSTCNTARATSTTTARTTVQPTTTTTTTPPPTTTATTPTPTTTTEQPHHHCQDFNCGGHGACIVIVDQPYCACLAGYHGTHCEVATPPPTAATTTTTTTTAASTIAPTTTTTTTTAATTTATMAAATTGAPAAVNTCNSTTTVTSIIHGTTAHNSHTSSCPSGSSATPEAFVLAHCSLSLPSMWSQGINVQEHCHTIPLYTPVATFINSVYASSGGLSGIFLGCLPDGFKFGVQQCDHSPSIIHVVNGGFLTMNPSIYYTVQ